MLDINFIRNNPEAVKEAARNKLMKVDIDRLLALDSEIRALTATVNELRSERNRLSKQNDIDGKPNAAERGREIKQELAVYEAAMEERKNEFMRLMLTVPSIPAPEVPVGKGEEDNMEIRRWGGYPRV